MQRKTLGVRACHPPVARRILKAVRADQRIPPLLKEETVVVHGPACSAMNAYDEIDGTPRGSDEELLTRLLRND
jgi:beta-glucosidase-like glycosyl hydrolase